MCRKMCTQRTNDIIRMNRIKVNILTIKSVENILHFLKKLKYVFKEWLFENVFILE